MMNNLAAELAEALKLEIKTALNQSSFRPTFRIHTQPSYLLSMCDQIIANADKWPATKLHRWIGYIQGCLVCHGFSDLEAEKELVRQAKEKFPETS